ncbi:MAG TPA: hypothetical protein VGS41_17555 [Chthonomonadales bacterium]|nr:hypothetical protein [Chthonomonadales bacterium]
MPEARVTGAILPGKRQKRALRRYICPKAIRTGTDLAAGNPLRRRSGDDPACASGERERERDATGRPV